MKLFTLYCIIAVLGIAFVVASGLDSYYQSQPNPSQPATGLPVQIDGQTINLQQAIDEKLLGGEAGTACETEFEGVKSFNQNSVPTCMVIR